MPININQNISFKGAHEPGQCIANAVAKRLPAFEIKSDGIIKNLQDIAGKISSPEQRLIMGVTAICSQPFFDLYNPSVSEDTRLTSFCRTTAKIIVGTTVGVLVRKGCINFAKTHSSVRHLLKLGSEKEFAVKGQVHSFFTPTRIRNYTEEMHKVYANTVGTALGVLVSLFTNFLIDAPLTQLFTVKLYDRIKGGQHESN